MGARFDNDFPPIQTLLNIQILMFSSFFFKGTECV